MNNIDLKFKMTNILNLKYILQNMIQFNIYIKHFLLGMSVQYLCLFLSSQKKNLNEYQSLLQVVPKMYF